MKFKIPKELLGYSNLSKLEQEAIRSLAGDRSIVIKKADKGSCVVVWDRLDYQIDGEKQLKDRKVYQEVNFSENIFPDLVEKSNTMFKNLRRKGVILEKQLKHFSFEYKKATNLGKLYLLPKIHKCLKSVPGRPVISICGTPTKKMSEFLDHHLKPVMQNDWSYIKDSGDFLRKIRNVGNIPENAILVTAEVVGVYPNIPHNAGLKVLINNMLEAREHNIVSTDNLIKMARFVLENNCFEFNGAVKKQISGTAISTKFAPPYPCIFMMNEPETKFSQTQSLQPLVQLRYIDDIFFIQTHGKGTLKKFLDDLNSFDNNIKFTHEPSKENATFLDLIVKLSKGCLTTDLHIKDTDRRQYLNFNSSYPDYTKRSIIYSQILRLTKICTFKNGILRHRDEIELWFQRRGYLEHVFNTEMKKVTFNGSFGKSSNKNKSVPFALTYHLLRKKVNYIIEKHIHLLYMNKEV